MTCDTFSVVPDSFYVRIARLRSGHNMLSIDNGIDLVFFIAYHYYVIFCEVSTTSVLLTRQHCESAIHNGL